MGNITSYVRLHADEPLCVAPLCEADFLALAMLSYADLAECVPPPSSEDSVSLREAYESYCALPHTEDKYVLRAEPLLRDMAVSRRFSSMRLSRFLCVGDAQLGAQFAALAIDLGNGTSYISYRGTDESIVGWREDFRMVYEITPEQQIADEYLRGTLQPHRRYILGGHSKGGALAFYAASQCPPEYRDQIEEIHMLDSPGLSRDLVPEQDMPWLEERTVRIAPGFSVVGTIFLYGRDVILVESTARRIQQHDAFSWQIDEGMLRRIPHRERESEIFSSTLAQWINTTTMYQRRTFVRILFDALEAGGATTLTELSEGGVPAFVAFLSSMLQSAGRTRPVVAKLLQAIVHNLSPGSFTRRLRGSATLRLGQISS